MNNIDHYWPPNTKTYSERWHVKEKGYRVCQGPPKTASFVLLNTKPSWELLYLLLKVNSKAWQFHYPLHPVFPAIKMEIER
jgi:hypothetical protein